MCELCDSKAVDHTPDSPVIPWTKVAMCDRCYQKWQDGSELEASVREL